MGRSQMDWQKLLFGDNVGRLADEAQGSLPIEQAARLELFHSCIMTYTSTSTSCNG